MAKVRFKSNLRFALHKESPLLRKDIPLNQIEQVGDYLAWIAYEFKSLVLNILRDPRFLTVLLTLLSMIITSIIFYPTKTLNIIFDQLLWIIFSIKWGYVRFGLWLLSEITILGLGVRAFGRFSNRKLMEHHGIV